MVDLDSSVVVDGRGPLAPGLVAARIDETGAAATSCAAPQPDYWFTGVGSASIHSSELELVNPDAGGAIADIEIYGDSGLLPVDAVRGVTVPGGTATTIDLAETAPDRSELTVHVTVTRGRLGASMVNRIADDGSYADWLPPQAEPASSTVLLGLAAGRGERQLVVANPSDDQARVQVKVIGSDSTFAALGLDELSIPPQSVSVTDVSDVVGDAVAKEESGLLVTSTRSRHERPAVGGRLSCRGPQPCRRRNAGARGRVVAPGGQGDAGAGRSHRGRLGDGDVVRRGRKAAGDQAGGRQATDQCRARPPGQDLAGRRPCRGDAAARGRSAWSRTAEWSTLPLQELVLSGLVPAVSAGWVQSAP